MLPHSFVRLVHHWGLGALAIGVGACGSDPGPGPEPTPTAAPRVTGVTLDDATNFGDGRDLIVAFDAPLDQSVVSGYRILIVAAGNAGFDLAAAEALDPASYTSVGLGTGRQTVTLAQSATDVDGAGIADGIRYTAFVMTVAGGAATTNALSTASNEVTVAVTTIRIDYLGNAGVLVTDDEHGVLIDALSGNLSGWIALPSTEVTRLTQAGSPYNTVDVVMTSHNHGDHFSPTAVASYMNRNRTAGFVGPPQVVSGLSLGARADPIAPARGERGETTINGVRVEVLHVRHFDQFGNNFGSVENYGFIVHLGGKKILHLGDVDYGAANLAPFGLDGENIDVVILPTFNTLLSAANASVIASAIAPVNVVALHFQEPQVDSESSQAASLYPGATTFTEALQFVRY